MTTANMPMAKRRRREAERVASCTSELRTSVSSSLVYSEFSAMTIG